MVYAFQSNGGVSIEGEEATIVTIFSYHIYNITYLESIILHVLVILIKLYSMPANIRSSPFRSNLTIFSMSKDL